ncbi:hypothetical protein [Caldifermentibacillus hisashii]
MVTRTGLVVTIKRFSSQNGDDPPSNFYLLYIYNISSYSLK